MAITCAQISSQVASIAGRIQDAAGVVRTSGQRINSPSIQNTRDLTTLLRQFENLQSELFDIEAELRDLNLEAQQLGCDVSEIRRQIAIAQNFQQTVIQQLGQIRSNLQTARAAEQQDTEQRPTATSAQQTTTITTSTQTATGNVQARTAANSVTVTNQAGYSTTGNAAPTVSASQVKTQPAAVTDDPELNKFLDDLDQDLATPFEDDGGAATEQLAQIQADAINARAQQAINEQNKAINQGDWRVRLSLAAGADYLYRAADPGILDPLVETNGIIFPYTPKIDTTYAAQYSTVDLTHSNYRGYFYQNSYVDVISITATFTAQDTTQANYLLATIHFLRSVTKMFYGQDANRGVPPPLVFLTGLGSYQFNRHPCLVRLFNYSLPDDVDYIRARSVNIDGTNLLRRRNRTILPTNPLESVRQRLENAGLPPGGLDSAPAAPTLGVPVQGVDAPTYVPTKMDITIELLPVQTRSQQSQQFSVKSYANGDLLKSGFW
jgi:hypothetical protein